MRRRQVLIAALALSASLVPVSAAYAQGTAKLDRLIRENGYYAERPSDAPGLVVVWPARDIGIPTAMTVTQLGGNDLVYMYAFVLDVPQGFQHPPAMLRKIAEINDQLVVGSVSISGDGSVSYNSSFWLETATANVLRYEIALVNNIVPALHQELSPFLNF